MRLAKLSLIFVLTIMLSVIALAQSAAAAYLFDPLDGTSTPVVVRHLGEIRKPLGQKFNLDVDAFAGVKREKPIIGTWVSKRWTLAENVTFNLGPAVIYEESRFRVPGMIFGVQFRL